MALMRLIAKCWKSATNGSTLARKFIQHATTFVDARKEMFDIATHIERVSVTLENLARALTKSDYDDSSKIIQSIWVTMDAMDETFEKIGAKVGDSNRESAPYRWMGRKGVVQNLVAELESQQRHLQFHLTALTMVVVGDIAAWTEETTDTLSDVRSEIRMLRFELAKHRNELDDGINAIEDDIEMLRRALGVEPLHDLWNEGTRASLEKVIQQQETGTTIAGDLLLASGRAALDTSTGPGAAQTYNNAPPNMPSNPLQTLLNNGPYGPITVRTVNPSMFSYGRGNDLGIDSTYSSLQAPQPGPAQAAVAPRPPLVPNTNFRPPEITRAPPPQRLDIQQYPIPRPPQSAPPNAPSTFMNRTPITNAPRRQPVGIYHRPVTLR